MFGLLLLTAALVGVCFLLGQGVLALCGAKRWRWWGCALGYAVLLIVGGQVIRVPNHQMAMAVLIVIAALASLASPFVRRAVAEAAPDAVPFGLLLLLVGSIPFFAIGHTGVLGASVSNDMSTHLTAAFYLRTGEGTRPVAAIGGNLIATGYPLGAQGLAALLTRGIGIGEERAFSAITLAIPIITAFLTLGVVPFARRLPRWALGAAVGFGYLVAAYFAQGSFKEITQALLVLATAVALHDLTREQPPRGWRRGLPIGLLIAASIYNYSYGGAFWMIGIAAVMLVAEGARHPRRLLPVLRAALIPLLGAAIVCAAVVAPEIGRIAQFTKSIFGVEPLTNQGNLFHAVNPLETIGLWFSGDFRFNPQPEWVSVTFSALGLAALIASAVWWWRRREFALPAAVVASIAIWADLALTRNHYNAAKGLVVLAPLAMACAGSPLAAAWSERAHASRPWLLRATRVLAVVLFAGAAVASFAVLRSAPVGLGSHEQELAALRPILRGHSVLFLSNDHFAQWELRGARVYVTTPLYAPFHLVMHPEKQGGKSADVDNYESSDLDKVGFILTPGGTYRSEIPPNFRLVMRTASYELFRRFGPTPEREPFEPPSQPGAIFDCTTPRARRYLAQYRWAGVLPAPVVSSDWHGSIGVPGHTATVQVRLPAGRWNVSLQYVSYTDVVVRGPQLEQVIAPNYGLVNAYWPAGTLTSDGQPFTLSLTSENRSWFGRLLGSPRPAISADTPEKLPLRHIAFTRYGATPQRIPASQACGRYVDWFAPAGSTMH